MVERDGAERNGAIFHVDCRLADFERWLSLFAEGAPRAELEAAHGVETVRVLRNTLDPNHAIVILRAATRQAVESMLDDARLRERFADRTLFAARPRVIAGFELTDLEPYVAGENPAFFVEHRLADFETFRDRLLARRETPGIKTIKLLRNIEDRDHVRLVVLAPDKATLENAMAAPRLQTHFADRNIFQQPPEIVFSPTSVWP